MPVRIALRITALAPTPSTSLSARPAVASRTRAAWRTRGRLAALAALLAALGAVLLVLSARDAAPLVVRVAPPAGLAVMDGRVWSTSPRAGTVTPSTPTARSARPCAWAARRHGSPPARTGCG